METPTPLLRFDDDYVYTYEIIDNVPTCAKKLRLVNISGYIADRQISSDINVSHVGVILGVDETSPLDFPNNLYVCALDNGGMNISSIEHFSANIPVKIIRPIPFDLRGILTRISQLTTDTIPAYNILASNCQTFVGNLVYGPGSTVPSPLIVLILVTAICAALIFNAIREKQ